MAIDNTERRRSIQMALAAFTEHPLSEAATGLLDALGYASDKVAEFSPEKEAFVAEIEEATIDKGAFPRDKALVSRWQKCAFLFQLTNDEIPSLAAGQQSLAVDVTVRNNQIDSFVFLAIELDSQPWNRTDLASITRELNRRFPMPVIIVFKHGLATGGQGLSLAVIDRRVNKKDSSRDVIDGKRITIIKDVRLANPNRAHLEILSELAIDRLGDKRRPTNFRDLYDAWMAVLSISELNKRFYREIADWYFWAIKEVQFPFPPTNKLAADPTNNSTSVIRLLTRLIFTWFLKEKGLVPDCLFDEKELARILKSPPAKGGVESPPCKGGSKPTSTHWKLRLTASSTPFTG